MSDEVKQNEVEHTVNRAQVEVAEVRVYDPLRAPRSTREMMTRREQQDMIDAGRW